MSRYWAELVCARCGTEMNPLNIETVIKHDNYTDKHGSYRYYYHNCGECKLRTVMHHFTEDIKEKNV